MPSAGAMESQHQKKVKKQNRDFFNALLNDDDDDDHDMINSSAVAIRAAALVVIAAAYYYNQSRAAMILSRRGGFHVRDRIHWENHVAQLNQEGHKAFTRLYRMLYASFVKLCCIIDPFMELDVVKSRQRWGKEPISTEIALHCLLRWFGGGSYLDIRLAVGISVSAFYRCLHRCMNAIVMCGALSFKFPQTEQQLDGAACEFLQLSTNSVVDGCVGCLDGFMLKIQTPLPKETENVKLYFSGHYQCYCINVQAVCDSQS